MGKKPKNHQQSKPRWHHFGDDLADETGVGVLYKSGNMKPVARHIDPSNS
jgi:hypothetical protein